MQENLLKRLVLCATMMVTLSIAAGCDRAAGAGQPGHASALPDSMGMEPAHVSIVKAHTRPELQENSTAAMSHRQSGVFFTINDSGNDPVLFAMDTTGADRGAWRVRDAVNVDWESAAMGPCSAPKAATECVYIGDTGDNYSRHKSRTVYRVAEPEANGATGEVASERLSYVYSDGSHDVEAMYVARNGDMFFITKRRLNDGSGALRPALMFRLSADEWSAHHQAVAQLVDSLSLVPASAPLRVITDASLSPDARHLAVRTYTQVYIYATDPTSGRVLRAVPPAICNIVSLGEPQGEGVTWANNAGRLVFTSEGQQQPIRIATCPLPRG